jgi:molybdate transport system substrate-binding protein
LPTARTSRPARARYIRLIEIPEQANVVASYPIAMIKDAREPDAAASFIELVLSSEGQSILERRGLFPAAATRP